MKKVGAAAVRRCPDRQKHRLHTQEERMEQMDRKMDQQKKTVEIRWHGRGGQGAKTACLLLADVAFNSGKYVQGFPEYGPERMGAPITAYNRISDTPNRVHSNIYEPDFVVVVDETLLHTVDVTKGLKEDGAIIINSTRSPQEVRAQLGGYKGRVCVVDAGGISVRTLGKEFPNTPMLAATVKVSQVIDPEKFLADMEESLRHKFATKPQVIAGNMEALRFAMDEIAMDEIAVDEGAADEIAAGDADESREEQ